MYAFNRVAIWRVLLSAENLCKQFGSRSSPKKHHSDRFFEKVYVKTPLQTTKKHAKLSSMQRVKVVGKLGTKRQYIKELKRIKLCFLPSYTKILRLSSQGFIDLPIEVLL